MALLARITGWFGWGGAIGQHSGQQSGAPMSAAFDDAPLAGPDAALQISAVWSCVDLLVKTIGSLPLMLYRELGGGMRDLARNELLWILLHDSPNSYQTTQEWLEYMSLNRFLRGNAYSHIKRSANGEALALIPMAADQVRPVLKQNGDLVYCYNRDGTEIELPAVDVLHWRGMGNDIVGLSPIDFMRASLGVAINAQNHTSRQYKNGGKPAGVLTVDHVLNNDQRTQLRNAFDGIANGPAANLYILEAAMKYAPISLSAADLQLLETRRFAIEDIARWFGVPSVLINDTAKTTTWGTGIEQLVEGFYKFTLRPELVRIEQAISRRVLTPAQRSRLKPEFNFEGLLRTSLGVRMEAYAKGVQNGIYKPNECRQLENMPPADGGDVLYAQSQLAPIHLLGQQPGAQNARPQAS